MQPAGTAADPARIRACGVLEYGAPCAPKPSYGERLAAVVGTPVLVIAHKE